MQPSEEDAVHIGEAARRSGLPPKTIRYYEDTGLLCPAERGTNGYRRYSTSDVHTLRFLRRARGLDFAVPECRQLLALDRDRNRSSAEVKVVAERRLADIDRNMAELRSLRRALCDLLDRCHGDERPGCPILDELAGVGDTPAHKEKHS